MCPTPAFSKFFESKRLNVIFADYKFTTKQAADRTCITHANPHRTPDLTGHSQRQLLVVAAERRPRPVVHREQEEQQREHDPHRRPPPGAVGGVERLSQGEAEDVDEPIAGGEDADDEDEAEGETYPLGGVGGSSGPAWPTSWMANWATRPTRGGWPFLFFFYLPLFSYLKELLNYVC